MIRDLLALTYFNLALLVAGPAPKPPAPGKLVDLGGRNLHVHCTGAGAPTVVIESGLGDFSSDWTLVQTRVARYARVCAYDRAGYAWSDPGPKPRTFAQINRELRDALAKVGERGPFVLVGHSFGGPVVRNFAAASPSDVAGIVFVDAAHEGLRVSIGGGRTIRLGEGARGRPIPAPRTTLSPADAPAIRADDLPVDEMRKLDPMFGVLPAAARGYHLWAQQQPGVYDAQKSETEWSEEYFARWLAAPQRDSLRAIPIVVLSPARQDPERAEGQRMLLELSSDARQEIVPNTGHNMHLEAPDAVASAVAALVERIRSRGASPLAR